MDFVTGTIKFTAGAVIGATVGAAVATLIVTRDKGQTLAQLRELVNDVLVAGREAYQAEEARMSGRYQQLIGDAGKDREARKQEKKQTEKQNEGK